MAVFDKLEKHHDEIVEAWVHRLLSDQSSPYSLERAEDLRPLVSQATTAFRRGLSGGGWEDLEAFITLIARKRLSQGFRLSSVQKASFRSHLLACFRGIRRSAPGGTRA